MTAYPPITGKGFCQPHSPACGGICKGGWLQVGCSQEVWALAPKKKWGWACLGKARPASTVRWILL